MNNIFGIAKRNYEVGDIVECYTQGCFEVSGSELYPFPCGSVYFCGDAERKKEKDNKSLILEPSTNLLIKSQKEVIE